MKTLYFFALCCFFSVLIKAQGVDSTAKTTDTVINHIPVKASFKSDLIINAQSNETLHKYDLVFNIAHRFGDFAGEKGGSHTFFGFDNSSDIFISLKYGITNQLMIEGGRAKGAPNDVNTFQKELYSLALKYRLLQQTIDNKTPVSITLYGNTVISGMKPLILETTDANFQHFSDRLSFVTQVIVVRKFNRNVSFALLPTYIHRNYVTYMDQGKMFALGFGGRLKFSKRMAFLFDYFIPFRAQSGKDYFKEIHDFTFYHPLGIALEIETGGHVFNLNFTNSTALLSPQFIPSTSTSWVKGAFRCGFNISRVFTLLHN